MKTHAVRLAIGLATFVVGVSLTALTFSRHAPRVVVKEVIQTEVIVPNAPKKWEYGGCMMYADSTPEAKAVRLAEEFVARNGYTDLPPDRDNLSYESIEWGENINELLKFRHDSLERRAYGIRYTGKMNGPGWTVAFRPALRYRCGNAVLAGQAEIGRTVTMDENFENLRVEHKDFPLANVHKKF